MQFSFSISELTEICAPISVVGSTTETIRGIASLRQARAGDLSFLGSSRYRPEVAHSQASLILVPEGFAGAPRENQMFFFVRSPSAALGSVCRRLEVDLWPRPEPGIHPTAVIDPSARVAPGAIVGPLCVIEADAEVGPDTWLEAGVLIGRAVRVGAKSWCGPGVRILARCEIGDRVRLHPGVVIGSDGFGYETTDGRHEKLPQVGNVIVRDDVEIGANTTVDRARFSSTVIGEGTKIDNLVQVAHNVLIGRHCIICAQVGLSGSTTIEDYVVIAGQAGTAGHLTIGKGSMIAARAAIYSDTAPGSRLKGDPPLALSQAQRVAALKKRLPELLKRIETLEEHLEKPATE